MKAETRTCDLCGKEYPEGQLTIFEGQHYCPSCLEEHTVVCRECSERILREDNAGTDNLPLCQGCCDSYYTTCTRCGALVNYDDCHYPYGDEDPYCESCCHLADDAIQSYYFKPTPIFYGQGPRFFGVELEIDGAGESDSHSKSLLTLFNRDKPLAYCKHDGSLNNGIEIVTHPLSLDCHMNLAPWEAVMDRAIKQGYTSHQAGTCGLHVHVSRAAFGKHEAEQDEAIARILYFFERFWEELLRFSRRTPRQLEQWAARYGYKNQPGDILDHAKKHAPNGRYSCVNLTNDHTIEFRIFRGTLKYNTLIATLQLVDKICDVALALSDDELKCIGWTEFVSGCTRPELVQYLKERRLYVNEPVQGEDEV